MKAIPINRTDILIGAFVSAIFVFFTFGAFTGFESLEKMIYGMEMRLDLSQNSDGHNISIVHIDEKSLQELGPWPWPRSVIADMINILKNNGAKIIGLDLPFREREPNQGLVEIQNLYKEISKNRPGPQRDPWVLNALKQAEKKLDNDRILSQTVKASGNIILPVLGHYGPYETEVPLTEGSFLKQNSLRKNKDIKSIYPVNQLETPFPELLKSCRGLGHNNFSPQAHMKGRVHLPFIDYRGHLIPSMPVRIALAYLDKRPEELNAGGNGIKLQNAFIPAFDGELFIKFKGGGRSFPYYSFSDILKVKKLPGVFDNKIVLIGYTANGATAVNTPVDAHMPRVELTANVIENLMSGSYLRRPGVMVFVESSLLLIFSMFAALALPRVGALSRIGLLLGMLLFTVIIGVLSFTVLDLWFKTFYIGLSLLTIYVAIMVRDFIIGQRIPGLTSKKSIETNRMLGLSLQSRGLLDLAFEKFRKCPLDDAMKDVIYNLGLDYERKRMVNKAVSVYEYILQIDEEFRDLNERIPKLKKVMGPLPMVGKEGKIAVTDDLEAKPTVGKYEILGELGQGAMGIVYKAQDPESRRLVAIKTIRFADEVEEEKLADVKKRFFQEAEIAGKLSHRSIVSIHDVGEDFDLTYMAMEYLEGDNLQKYCRKGALLPLRKVLYIVGETALALGYAHKHGVVHRDVKPANIMLLKNGRIKVTDFGIAKAVSASQTKSGIILGTPNYMSPEQINGRRLDGRSDIFSLGIVFFELLTGQLPFNGKTLANLFYQITQVKHPSPRTINPKVPKLCEQMIERILNKDPKQRFQTANELARYARALIDRIDRSKPRPRAQI